MKFFAPYFAYINPAPAAHTTSAHTKILCKGINVINLRKIIVQFTQRVESCPGGVGGCAPDLTQYIGGMQGGARVSGGDLKMQSILKR